MMKIHAIIPSAGLGKRFGAAKQFLTLKGKPLLLYALETFGNFPGVEKICVPVPASEVKATENIIPKDLVSKVQVVAGGDERQESVRLGFEALPPSEVVLVHDGVRPFVSLEMIQRVLEGVQEHGACIVGIPVKDTTKRSNDAGLVQQTVDRKNLWSIQTPQGFRYEIFKEASLKAHQTKFLGTDESMLVEMLGIPVKIIQGSPYNIKITVPEDLKIAEVIVKIWKESERA
jgi:2-C-methyl-D-erythritol 4-phosphate cytidylyltransferase